jgi:hypothetical protein
MRRFDLLFSYWIFTWYLFYIFGLTTYNPTLALMLGIIENMTMLFSMYKTNTPTIILFIIALFLMKILPFFSITHRIQFIDFIVTMLLFIIYVGWLYINGLTLMYPLKLSKDVINNKIDLPFTFFMKKILKIKLNE